MDTKAQLNEVSMTSNKTFTFNQSEFHTWNKLYFCSSNIEISYCYMFVPKTLRIEDDVKENEILNSTKNDKKSKFNLSTLQ